MWFWPSRRTFRPRGSTVPSHPMANNTWICEEQARFYNSVEWYATVRGRAGFAYKSYLPFITAGLAYAGVTSRDTHEGGTTGTDLYKNVFGVAAGAGIEKAFSEHLTAQIDALYIGLQTMKSKSDKDYYSDNNFTVVRAGLNWKF
ncbi:porin family protein [Rhodobacterales bacterium]|nr:porin family protein [Rhodobacterales bacterium]